jgi:hypothetical protein
MKNAELVALVKTLQAQIATLSATQRKPSDLKIVVTTGIPSKSGRPWATLEITDTATGEVTKCFLDNEVNAKDRTDGAKQRVLYATRMGERTGPSPAPAAPVADEDISFGNDA